MSKAEPADRTAYRVERMLAGVYGRVSVIFREAGRKVEHVFETSVGRQFADSCAWVTNQGGKVVRTYADEGISAHSGAVRAEFERLLDDIERRIINTVVCWKLDRLTRNHADFERLWEACEQNGVRLVSLHEMFDSSTPAGEFTIRMLVSMAKMESDNISLRVSRALEAAAVAGRPHGGGSRPFGYDRPGKGRLVIIPDEAEVLQEAARRVITGGRGNSLRGITADFVQRGVKGTRGGPLRIDSLRDALLSPLVAGLVVHRGKIIGPGNWEPILDRWTWERVRNILKDPTRRVSPTTDRRRLLSGFLRCGLDDCGHLLYNRPKARRTRPDERCYLCMQGDRAAGRVHLVIAAEKLEAVVVESILKRFDGPGLEKALIAREGRADARQLGGQIATDDQALVELGRARFVTHEIEHGPYLIAKRELEDRIREARTRLARIAARRELAGVPTKPGTLRKAWPKLSLEQQRAVIRLVLDEIVIMPSTRPGRRFDTDRIDPHWAA